MIFTFFYGIDAIFRINKSIAFDTITYFMTFIISIVGWFLLKGNKSVVKNCLGFIFIPAFSLFNTLYPFGSYLRKFHKKYFLIFGSIYFIIFVASLVSMWIKAKKRKNSKIGIQFVFIVISGLMFFISNCILLIASFEQLFFGIFCFSLLLIVFYYLKSLSVMIYNEDIIKFGKLNKISNALFWIYLIVYDLACFTMAASSV